MGAMPRQTVVGWVLAGGIAIAAMAIGYGLGRAGDEHAAGPAAWEDEGADVGPLGGDEASPPVARETRGTESARAGSEARRAASPLSAGQRVAVDTADHADAEGEPLEPELVREERDGFFGFGREREVITIPAGTPLRIRLVDGASSQTSQVGDAVAGELTDPVVVEGRAVAAAGTRVEGRVAAVQPVRKIGGQARLHVVFHRLAVGADGLPIEAGWSRIGKSETGRDAATIAGGAAAGVVIGNQAKSNDKGKVIGGLLGAGIGSVIAAKGTPGQRIELPAGTVLEVTLVDSVVATMSK
jgi:hypothetical protein